MTKVYGYSDDLLVIEGAPYPSDEIGCFDATVEVTFTDGTVIKAQYPKKDKAIWKIEVLKKGTASQNLVICEDEDAEIYSDVFTIDAEYKSHKRRDYR